MSSPPVESPPIIVFTSAHCPHCSSVLKIFNELKQNKVLSGFEVYDVARDRDLAEQFQVRSVPWFRIGKLEFQGLHSAGEIQGWLEAADTEQGIVDYLTEELNAGRLDQVLKLLRQNPDWLQSLIHIIADMSAPIQARIGLGAVLEELAYQPTLTPLVPLLEGYSQHQDHNVRSDACHYLGLIDSEKSQEILQRCCQDESEEVREIANESLQAIAEHHSGKA